MDLTFKSPIQIYINDKWFCTAQEVYVGEKRPTEGEGITPHNQTATIINIKKQLPRPKEEKDKNKKTMKKVEGYDDFFNRMVGAVDDPNAHLPIDL